MHTQAAGLYPIKKKSTRGIYNTPSHEGVILNELFVYREKDRNRLNKYSIPSKLSLHVADISIKTARLLYLNSNLITLQ